MPNPFNNSLSSTTPDPGRVYKSYQHATRLYTSGDRMPKMPKLGFMYYVSFNLSPGLKSNQWEKIKNDLGFLAKKVDLPKYKIQTTTLNQYNRKANIQQKVTYDPVSIEFHDDNSQITSSLWRLYYDYYYQDGRNKEGKFDQRWQGDTKYKTEYVYGYDSPENTAFFSSIDMYVFHNGRYSLYSIANPLVTAWDHDSLDQGNGLKILQNKISFLYDDVSYHEGEIFGEERIRPAIEDAAFYDSDVNINNGYRPENKPYVVDTPSYPTPQLPGLSLSQLDKAASNQTLLPTGLNFNKLSNLHGPVPYIVPPRPLGAGTIGLTSTRPPGFGISGIDVWYGYGGLHGRAVINAGPIRLAIKK